MIVCLCFRFPQTAESFRSLTAVRGDGLQELRAVALGFDRADAVDGKQLRGSARQLAAHIQKRRVGEYHERRNALPVCDFEPQRAQCIQQRRVDLLDLVLVESRLLQPLAAAQKRFACGCDFENRVVIAVLA